MRSATGRLSLDARQRRLLWLLAAACFTEGYDFNAIIVALPHLRDTFGLTESAADLWVAGIYLGAAPALLLGRRADRRGRRGVMLTAILGYTICSVLTAVAPSIGVFVALQFVARCFLTVQVAVAWTVAAEELPAERRGFGFGILALASAVGTGFGAIVQAALLAPLGASWRWIYAASLPIVLVVILLRRALPESRRYEALAASGRMHGVARDLLRRPYRRTLLVICATMVLAQLTTQASVFAIDYMQSVRSMGTSTANLILVAAGGLALPVLVRAGRLSDRIGRRPVCSVALLIQAGGLVAFFHVAAAGSLLATLAIAYVGVFGAWTTGSAFGVEAFPTALRATAGASVTMAKLLGQCTSFVASAVLLGHVDNGLAVALLAIGPVIASVLVATTFPETSRRELADADLATAPPQPVGI